MQRKILLAGLFALALFFAIQTASAYTYYDDYSHRYTYQESYGPSGSTITERRVDQSPWGSVTTYKKIENNDPYYYGYARNPVYNYWKYGPEPRYTYTYNTYNGYARQAYPIYAQSNYYPYREHSCLYDYCGPRSQFAY